MKWRFMLIVRLDDYHSLFATIKYSRLINLLKNIIIIIIIFTDKMYNNTAYT